MQFTLPNFVYCTRLAMHDTFRARCSICIAFVKEAVAFVQTLCLCVHKDYSQFSFLFVLVFFPVHETNHESVS